MRRRPSRAPWPLLAALALLPALAPRAASAEAPVTMTAAERRRARALYDEAEKHVDAERWADALAKLEALAAINKATETPVVVFYTGLCKANLGRLRESLQDYKRALELLAAARAPARERKLLEEQLDVGVADLEARIPRVTLRRRPGDPAGEGLKLSVDGAELEPASALDKPHPLDPGEHRLRAELAAMKPFEKEFTLAERQSLELSLDFEPVERPKPPKPKPPPPPPPPSGAQKAFGYVALGLGGAALVGGGVHVALDRFVGDKDKNADLVSLGLGGGGLLGVGAGIVLLATAPSAGPEAGAAAPAPGLRFGGGPSRGGASAWVGGSF
ncbi:MAG TPA: hypothetical protein VFS43_01845 [Polyangiaceae bacterium]|nr:hypothetical protein [Polyangiaceae bacterium]